MKSGKLFFSFCRSFISRHVPLHMQHYMLCFTFYSLSVLVFSIVFSYKGKVPSSFVCFFFPFLPLYLYKSSKLTEFTNFLYRHKCLFTSSLFVSGHLPPSFIIPFIRVFLYLFKMGHYLIKRSEFWEPVWQGHVWSSIIENLYR